LPSWAGYSNLGDTKTPRHQREGLILLDNSTKLKAYWLLLFTPDSSPPAKHLLKAGKTGDACQRNFQSIATPTGLVKPFWGVLPREAARKEKPSAADEARKGLQKVNGGLCISLVA